MEWIFLSSLIVFLVSTEVFCLNCIPEVDGSLFWVKEGHPFAVNCTLRNCKSMYGTQWWMNGKRVFGMDFTKRIYETTFLRRSKLVINPVRPEDEANLTCINSIDSSKNVSIILKIGVPYSSSTQTPSSASHKLRSWTENTTLVAIVYLLSNM